MKMTVVGFWGGFPEVGEATSGYLFEHDGFRLLVDCGSGVLAQLQKYITPSDIDAVLLSHYHHDHVADIGVLQYARLIASLINGGLPELPIYGHTFDEKGFASLTHIPYTKGVPYNPGDTLEIGPFSISFLQTVHPVICFAMRITAGGKTVVYTADSSYMPKFVSFAQNADVLICECNMYAHQDGSKAGHMNSTEAGEIAKQANVGELLLTHLPHAGELSDLVTEAKQIFNGRIALAHSGYVWES
ncbi:Ribonuclease BN, tRNA processing enzyme [Bacillus sp. 491mf]|uniref:MBL fold metallo-hydrolase n=1 Tax=Bacillus sp. 491mf TaxID=1761755 RepID=UPI0008DF34EF|nr:MBL fold metallo-hydrolase [Bacillus sp. 491mf]SFC27323.1 Ribonuclease BN, tRNA processing enzyme [Bacillus sp. 491mf]